MATESLTNTHTLIVSLAQEGIGGAGEKLDEIRLVVAVLDRALVLAGMVDTLEEINAEVHPSLSRLVTLFASRQPAAEYAFGLWCGSEGLSIDKHQARVVTYDDGISTSVPAIWIAYRMRGDLKRDIAALHLDGTPQ